MFKIFLPNQVSNAATILNKHIGLFKINLVTKDWTGGVRGERIAYDPIKTKNVFETNAHELNSAPAIVDCGHIDSSTWEGRAAVANILSLLHKHTGHSIQAGLIRDWPSSSKDIKIDRKWIGEAITDQYKQDKYGSPCILPNIQFITCWTHLFTTAWNEWEDYIKIAYDTAKQFQKPIYADLALCYYQPKIPVRALTAEHLTLALEKIYHSRFDGVVLRGCSTFNAQIVETLVNVMNQINEE